MSIFSISQSKVTKPSPAVAESSTLGSPDDGLALAALEFIVFSEISLALIQYQ